MHILRERGRWCIKEEIGSVVVVIVPKASRAPRRRRRTRLVARPWRIMLSLRITPRECRRFNCCNLLLDRNKTEENENDISSPRAPPCNCLVDNKCGCCSYEGIIFYSSIVICYRSSDTCIIPCAESEPTDANNDNASSPQSIKVLCRTQSEDFYCNSNLWYSLVVW